MSKSNSPLMTILTTNKLVGENYVDWKRNLDIVLTVDKHKYVLTTPCPEEPAEDAAQVVKDEYTGWLRSDEVAKCYILASVSNVLQQQHQAYDTAADMIYNLKEMFGDQGRQARRLAVKNFMNCRMKAGSSVRDHMLVIMGHLNEMEIMGAEIDAETQVDMILETLPSSFDNFKLNYSMNKLTYSLAELMKELQVAESINGKRKEMEANVSTKVSTSGPKKRNMGKKAFKAKPKSKPKTETTSKVDKSEHECHFCKKKGHWKRNCPDYLASIKGKGVQKNKKPQ